MMIYNVFFVVVVKEEFYQGKGFTLFSSFAQSNVRASVKGNI